MDAAAALPLACKERLGDKDMMECNATGSVRTHRRIASEQQVSWSLHRLRTWFESNWRWNRGAAAKEALVSDRH